MNTNWIILKLVCKSSEGNLSNVVSEVYWKYEKSSTINGTTFKAKQSGYCTLESPDPATFTFYEELTKEQVVNWIELSLGQEFIDKMDNQLTENLSKQTNMTILELPFEN